MSITLRNVKGSSLTYGELDDNFIYLSQSYLPTSSLSSIVVASASYAATSSYIDSNNLRLLGNLTVLGTASFNYLHVTYESASVIYSSGSNQFGDATNDTQLLIGKIVMTGSVEVSGSISASDITGSLFGTASISISSSYSVSTSYAATTDNAVSSSYPFTVTGSSIRSHNTSNINANNSNIIGNEAGILTNNANYSNMMGYRAGAEATNAEYATFIGDQAGYQAAAATNATFIGRSAGWQATSGSNSVAIGNASAIQVRRANSFTFIGAAAGNAADGAQGSTFVGYAAGQNAISASYSVHLGYRAGYTEAGESGSGNNNIIIGTNVNVAPGRRDAINIGGILFGSGSYNIPFQAARSAFSGSANGKIGINQPFPSFELDVSGSGRFTNGVTASLFGTSSWAANAVTSSYPIAISGSTIYSPISFYNIGFSPSQGVFIGESSGYNADKANGSIFIGSSSGFEAISASFSFFAGNFAGFNASSAERSNFLGPAAGTNATNASYSNFLGNSAGADATNGDNSNFLGYNAGYAATNAFRSNFMGTSVGYGANNAYHSNFLGPTAGFQATNAYYSNFIGNSSGHSAISASNSNFLGTNVGYEASSASYSNFSGYSAGFRAVSASYSTLIGYKAGYASTIELSIKSNNIIIGTNITLEQGRRDSINLGGLIFGTGSYSNVSSNTFSGSANGRIGVNQPIPQYSLDVSGSGGFSNGLTVTGSLKMSTTTGTPSNTSTPAGYYQAELNGSTVYIPYYT